MIENCSKSSHLSELFVTNSPMLEVNAAEITDEQLPMAAQINNVNFTYIVIHDSMCLCSMYSQVLSDGIKNAEDFSSEIVIHVSRKLIQVHHLFHSCTFLIVQKHMLITIN